MEYFTCYVLASLELDVNCLDLLLLMDKNIYFSFSQCIHQCVFMAAFFIGFGTGFPLTIFLF